MPDHDEPIWTSEMVHGLPAWTLVQAYHVVAHRLYELFARYDLTPTQFGVLVNLDAEPGLIQTELARRILVRPQSVGELIRGLADRGLVERSAPTGRGRSRATTLTTAGRDLLERVTTPLLELNDPANLGLTGQQSRTLNSLLHKLIENTAAGRPE